MATEESASPGRDADRARLHPGSDVNGAIGRDADSDLNAQEGTTRDADEGPSPAGSTSGADQAQPTVDALHDYDTGRWQVTTRTSIYLLDLDQGTLLRIPGAAGDQGPDPETGTIYTVTILEGDHRVQPIWTLLQCRVDRPMCVYTLATAPAGVLLRISTPIRQIRRLAGPPSPESP